MARWAAHGYLTAGGHSLEYACFGPAPDEAPSILLLHEGLGCVALWRDFPQALSQATGWGVAAFSRAGYGQSESCALPRPLDYQSREAVEVLPGVLDALQLRRTVLLGHSDGATMAAVHAGEVQDPRVVGIVLMAPHFFTEPVGLAEIRAARVAYETGDLRDRLFRYHADVDTAFRGWNDAWLDPGFEAWNVEEVLDTIHVPVLAIQGRQDQYGTLAQIDVVQRRVPGPVTRLVIENCRHAPHLDAPEQVLSAVAKFTAGLP